MKLLSAGKAPVFKTGASSGVVMPSTAIDTSPVNFDLSEGGLLESESWVILHLSRLLRQQVFPLQELIEEKALS